MICLNLDSELNFPLLTVAWAVLGKVLHKAMLLRYAKVLPSSLAFYPSRYEIDIGPFPVDCDFKC